MRPSKTAPKVKATIVSLWHIGFHCSRPYREYMVPPRPDNGLLITDPHFCETFGELVIEAASQKMDIGEKRGIPQPDVDAYAIADDLVEADQLRGYGVFVPDGDEPTKKDLQAAQGLLLKKARILVQEGDTKYSKPQTRAEISDLNRWAVAQLEEKREWVYIHEETVKEILPRCRSCGTEALIPDPAVCFRCGFEMNPKKARELAIPPRAGLAGAAMEEIVGPKGSQKSR